MKRFLLVALLFAGILCAAGASPLLVPSIDAATEPSLSSETIDLRMQGDRLSLDVRDADIAHILDEIAARTGIGITVGDGISGKVSLQLTDATVTEVLKALCQSQALVYEYLPEKNTYRIIQALALPATAETGRPRISAATGNELAGKKAAATGDIAMEPPASPKTLSPQAPSPGGIPAQQAAVDHPAEDPARPAYAPRELLVKFKEGVPADAIDALHRSLGSRVLGNIPKLNLQRIKLKEGLPEEEVRTLYEASPLVARAERHALRYPNLVPNDRSFSTQWALTKIRAPEAWEITQGNQDVVVAFIDTGINYTHPDLTDNIWINTGEIPGNGIDDDNNGYVDDIRGWDFAGGNAIQTIPDNDPMDIYGHGTHLAGIVAARGNNGLGIAGINWRLRLMPLKVEVDGQDSYKDFAIIEAIQYAIDNGAQIVVCSFGGTSQSAEELAAFTSLKNARNGAGIIAACAAGNGDNVGNDGIGDDNDITHNYPSDYTLSNIISVAASDRFDRLASYSNYGLTSVDLMAPGSDVYSTVIDSQGTRAAFVRTEGSAPAEYAAVAMAYAGTTGTNGITGVLYDCGQGYTTDDQGHTNQFPAGVSGNIALIKRGKEKDTDVSFTFADKVKNAQNAGAKGVIVYNHLTAAEDTGFDEGGGTLGSESPAPGVAWVPVVSLTKVNGEALLQSLQSGTSAVTLFNSQDRVPYGIMSGTSMAAPHVAGVAGLLLAQCPALGYQAIKSAILSSADKIDTGAKKTVSGGRLNAFAALKAALPPGDLSGNCRVGIEDAVLALQLLAGLPTESAYPCPTCGGNLDGDAQIGLSEAIFILQKTAELR